TNPDIQVGLKTSHRPSLLSEDGADPRYRSVRPPSHREMQQLPDSRCSGSTTSQVEFRIMRPTCHDVVCIALAVVQPAIEVSRDERPPDRQFLKFRPHPTPGSEAVVNAFRADRFSEKRNVAITHIFDFRKNRGIVGWRCSKNTRVDLQDPPRAFDACRLSMQRSGMPEHSQHVEICLCRPPDVPDITADENIECRPQVTGTVQG